MIVLGDILFGAAGSLLASFVENRLKRAPEGFAAARVDAKINEISCAIMEPLTEFLVREGATKQTVEQIVKEVTTLVEAELLKTNRLVEAGLDVDLITENLLAELKGGLAKDLSNEYPEQFHMITRAFVQLAVDVPPMFANWETTKFQTHYRQLDELRNTLAQIYEKMESVTTTKVLDQQILERICAYRVSLSALKLTIHGLRQSAIPQADIDKLFVQPRIVEFSAVDDNDDVSVHKIHEIHECHDSFLAALKPGTKVLMTAGAGAGKSTWSEWLGIRALSNAGPQFTLVKHLRKIDNFKEAASLLKLVKQETPGSFGEQIGTAEVVEWARNGRVLLVFDGLDEVAENARDDALLWIEGIVAAYPGTIAIVTSRPLSTDHGSKMLESGWGDFQIAAFDDPRVTEYITKFQQHGPKVMTGAKKLPAKALAKQWMLDPTIGPLTRNPLLLSTLLVVHHMDGELPDDRAQLYFRYVDGMLGLWETKKELVPPSIPLTKIQKMKILQTIAINMISAEVDAVGQNTASNWIGHLVTGAGYDGKTTEVLEHLRERSGLLIGPGQYTFAHKSIGEFLTASACLEGIYRNVEGEKFNEDLLFANCEKDRWNAVLFLWAGLAPSLSVQEFIERLLDRGSLSVAGGLMYDRRKFLDPEWLRTAFWKLVRKGAVPGGHFDKETNSTYVSPGYFEGPNNIVVSAYSHKFASLTNDVDERALLVGLYEIGIFDAKDLTNEIRSCGWSFWYHFQCATRFDCPGNINSLTKADRSRGEFATAYAAIPATLTPSNDLVQVTLGLLENERIFEACQICTAQDICEALGEILVGNRGQQGSTNFGPQSWLDSLEDSPVFQKLFREGHKFEEFRSGEFDEDCPEFYEQSPMNGQGYRIADVFLGCADLAEREGLQYPKLIETVRFVGKKYIDEDTSENDGF